MRSVKIASIWPFLGLFGPIFGGSLVIIGKRIWDGRYGWSSGRGRKPMVLGHLEVWRFGGLEVCRHRRHGGIGGRFGHF